MDTENLINPQARHLRLPAAVIQEEKDRAKVLIADWPAAHRAFAEDLISGYKLGTATLKHSLKAYDARVIAMTIGWRSYWRATSFLPGFPRRVTLTDEHILSLYRDSRKTLQEIGELAGNVTRERIRQILLRAGHDPIEFKAAKIEQKKKVAAALREDRITLRKSEHWQYYEPWRAFWAEGLTVRQIAERVRVTDATAACTICRLRKKNGWFPYRRVSK